MVHDRHQEMILRRQLEMEHSRREQEAARRMQEVREREARCVSRAYQGSRVQEPEHKYGLSVPQSLRSCDLLRNALTPMTIWRKIFRGLSSVKHLKS